MTNIIQLKKNMNRMPRIVRLITGAYDAWVVGGAADPNDEHPRDWDVAVSFSDWHHVSNLIPKTARPTLFGGWKFESDGQEVDVWPCEIMSIWKCAKCNWMWQPRLNIRVKRDE